MAIPGFDNQLAGRVVSVNEKGLKFEGAGAWINVSKYAVGVTLPERGQEVTVTLDTAGFLRAVQLRRRQRARRRACAACRVDYGTAERSDHHPPGRPEGRRRVRGVEAAELERRRPESSCIVERWVLRDESALEELIDAF